jgi:hypothetical protein
MGTLARLAKKLTVRRSDVRIALEGGAKCLSLLLNRHGAQIANPLVDGDGRMGSNRGLARGIVR